MYLGCIEKPIKPTPSPTTPIEPSMTLGEIYREFYYDILGWENAYDSSTLHRYIEQKDEEKLREALEDFDTIGISYQYLFIESSQLKYNE